MYSKNSIYVILFLIVLISCTSDDTNLKVNNTNINENEKIPIKFGNINKEVPLMFSANAQKIKDRNWNSVKMELDFKIGGIDDTVFVLPTQIAIDNNNNLYVLDIRDYSVKKINSKGAVQYKLGRKGKGPGEFISPFRIDVLSEDKIVVADLNLKKIVVFENKSIFEYYSVLSPIDVSYISDDEIVILQILNPIDNSCIQKINFKSKSIEDYDNIIDVKNIDNEILGIFPFLDGDIHHFKHDIIYVPNVLNYLIHFNQEGKLVNVNNTIDNINNLNTDVKSFNLAKFPHPKKFVNSHSGVFDETLYLISNFATKKEETYVVDFYSIDECIYQYSIKLTGFEEIVDIKFTEKKLFILNRKTEVAMFSYKIFEED